MQVGTWLATETFRGGARPASFRNRDATTSPAVMASSTAYLRAWTLVKAGERRSRTSIGAPVDQ